MAFLLYPDPVASKDKALEDAIAQLKTNETADDATVAALETLVKAIPPAPDISGKAEKTALSALEAIVNPLPAKITALESRPTQIVRSSDPPDHAESWDLWIEQVKDFAAWTLTSTVYVRVDADSDYELGTYGPVVLRPAGHDSAVADANGIYRNTLRLGVSIEYNPSKTKGNAAGNADIAFTWPAGVVTSIRYSIQDATGVELSNSSVVPIGTREAVAIQVDMPGVAKIVAELTCTSETIVYEFPVLD